MPVQNMRIVSDIWSDDGTITASSAAGSMTAAKLQNSQPSDVWRSTNATVQTLSGNLGNLLSVSAFCLYNHNLDSAATIRVELATDSGFTNKLRDETISLGALDEGLGQGGLGTSGLGGFSGDSWQQTFTISWFAPVLVQYWRITLTNTGNADGYLQAGRLILGRYWSPTLNLSYGYRMGWREQTQQRRTRGGALRSDTRPAYRVATGLLQWMDASEESTILDVQFFRGKRKDLLFSGYPEDGTVLEQKHTILGRLTDYDDLERLESGRRWNFTIEESL